MPNERIIAYMEKNGHENPVTFSQTMMNIFIRNNFVTQVEADMFMRYIKANCSSTDTRDGGGTIKGYIAFISAVVPEKPGLHE